VSSSVPPTPVEAASPRRRWWPFVLMVVAGLTVTAVGLAAFIQVPYYGISPGDARSVNDRITITGAEVYPPEGEQLFVTVGVPRLTALGAVLGWIDPDTDVVEEERILGDRTPEENREENLQLMTYSKDFATYVALRELGFPVKVEDGGVTIDSLCMSGDDPCSQPSPADDVLDAGDLLTAIDGEPVNLPDDIGPAIEGKAAGDLVEVVFERDGEEASGEVALTTSTDGRVILGIIPNPLPPSTIEFTFPVDVAIDSGQVGGPSAGLAFTLALLDELTPGELTGGVTVAATGTIDPNGTVGEIGGIRQKTVAVQRTGAKLFLVPASLAPIAAQEAAGSGLEVAGVADLDDALEALATLGGNALALGTPGASVPPPS